MTKQDTIRKQIDHIMDTFEFGDIIKMMEATEWMYMDDDMKLFSPDETDIRQLARKLMNDCVVSKGIIGTGGFTVVYTDGIEDKKQWVKIELFWGVTTLHDGEHYDED